MNLFEEAEAIYGLTPMQESMLLYSRAGTPGTYLGQLTCRLEGLLDPDALRRAFAALVERHTALRTAIADTELERPLQVVKTTAEVPFTMLDWSALDPATQRSQEDDFLRQDRSAAMALDTAPLMRVTLVRLGPRSHRLIWTRHHLLMDGWAMALAIDELDRLYRAETTGTAAGLQPTRPFQDYVEWLGRRDVATDAAFWRAHLGEFSEPTTLVEGGTLDAAAAALVELARPLSEARIADLHETAQSLGVTVATLLTAAWALVVARHAGRDTVLFGLTVSGRPPELDGVENCVGLFLNTVPLRLDLPPALPLRDWVREVQRALADVEAHAHTPPGALRTLSHVPADRPLFDHILVLEGASMAGAVEAFAGLRVRDYSFVDQTNFGLNVGVQIGEPATLLVVYDPTRFDASRADDLADDFEAAVGAVAGVDDAAFDRPLGDLAVISARHRTFLDADFNATQADPADARGLLARIAAQDASACALIDEGARLDYGRLWQAAGALAEEMNAAGIGREDIVALVLERGFALPLSAIGVLRAGAAFLPLDPDDPPARLDALIAETGARLVLTQPALAPRLAGVATPLRVLDDADLDRRPTNDPAIPEPHPEAAAYAIFTSGSTGRPKAVVNTHRGLFNRIDWMQRAYPIGPGDRVLHKTPCTFDVAVWELIWPLTAGATMVIAAPGGHRDPGYVRDVIAAQHVTLCHFVPSMLRAFLATEGIEGCRSLRRVICSGEALAGADRDLLRRRLGASLHNLYGPAEAAIDVSWHDCADDERDVAVPIGRPIANSRLHLLDRHLRPVPPGAVGEIYIAGANLARGYLGRAALTAERFVPDGTAAEPGGRLYRTGDLARFDASGELVYLGRADFQVKLRGMRIEVGEIEAALAALPDVQAAAVVLAGDGDDARLVAHLVPADGRRPDASALRAALAARLPEAMIPAAFMVHAALPLSANGKLDRAALTRAEALPADQPAQVAPRSDEERTIAEIWAQVLGLPEMGVTTDFFALGGHSLLLVQVASRLREAFGTEVPLRTLFNARTVEAMLDAVLEAELANLDDDERAALLAEAGDA